ncbi:hypothetical protein CHS0354_007491 [Potamilus streckersoni]|uniref:Uncharacterized protein n=1 Tax=Potamilus streckersoni TaxID=2493646 RepID=A0AAE0W9P8_9BIVA|nr:hypothetical protein CHS0354_007491 [Potamilus streckersoni]
MDLMEISTGVDRMKGICCPFLQARANRTIVLIKVFDIFMEKNSDQKIRINIMKITIQTFDVDKRPDLIIDRRC